MPQNPYGTLGPSPSRVAKITPKPKRTARAAAPVAARPKGLSAQDWADQQAQRVVDEMLAAIREQQSMHNQTLQEEAARQAQQAQNFARMVQGLGIDKQIQGIYGSAGRDIAGLAQGFSGQLRDTAAADAAAQTRMLSGTGQEGAVRNEGVGMGDVLYGVGGAIPGRTLGEQGAGYAADAAMQPGFMLEQRVAASQDALRQGLQESDKSFLDAILEAKTSKREISQQFKAERVAMQKQEQDRQIAAAKVVYERQQDERDYWLRMQAYYMGIKKYKLSEQAGKRSEKAGQRADAAAKRANNASQGLDAEGNVAPGYVRQPNGVIVKRSDVRSAASAKAKANKDKGLDVNGKLLPGYTRKNGRIVKVATPRAATPAKKATPEQKAAAVREVMKQEEGLKERDLPELAKKTGLHRLLAENPNATPKEVARLQKSVIRALWVRYGPTAGTPATKAALRAMINRLVKTYKPGAGGDVGGGALRTDDLGL
jgi:hypothetical protein